ncbi:hypothetical protein PR202_ga22977 [Eleusine coracana subsp. coracana]|uniref:Uncharacterized protein n=1 Tax=Eleusine coracana subsp. coracana TaxID=191504 RepID=A0AAV5D4L1_ELECO|nr:hypothetical protein PR202_ga22977 [Eleusine coracana subsp. coracana]
MEEEDAGRKIDREQQRGRPGSGRVAALAIGGDGSEIEVEMAAATSTAGGAGPSSSGQQDHVEDELLQRPAWKRFLTHVGPGFLVSLAYLDPSNVQTDLQAGSSHKYELLWVLLFGFIFVLMIQSLAAKLGIITGRHLAELCMSEYPKRVKYGLWFLAEVGVIAATVPGASSRSQASAGLHGRGGLDLGGVEGSDKGGVGPGGHLLALVSGSEETPSPGGGRTHDGGARGDEQTHGGGQIWATVGKSCQPGGQCGGGRMRRSGSRRRRGRIHAAGG